MLIIQEIIHQLYFVLAAIICLFLVKNLFKRNKRQGWVYDIVYAYVIVTFILRVLHIK
ncbi:MAG TPA: hypothetical protein PLM73_03625 [Petrotogaceae bacterium]|jgi:putative effector of murein hydrolase|nr:hypothetical protein [Petrotogaceae bacterium]HNY36896.1 hypothetical protein [Petrotogaceae bacterium]HOG33686.1 hypothetical protein [Petrotogaceae bacterium]HPA94142.1 hypothetical protein [Petrotogaceae bacterium]HQF32775.1 hypothetical protein [Petrotogaceae bacterium]